jgi:hypothetical protein
MSGRNSVVECQLPKLDVAGSTPVARSNFYTSSNPTPACGGPVHRLVKILKYWESLNVVSRVALALIGCEIAKIAPRGYMACFRHLESLLPTQKFRDR